MDNTETLHRLAQLMITRPPLSIALLDSLAPDEVPAGIAEVIRCRHGLMAGRIRPSELEARIMALQLPPDCAHALRSAKRPLLGAVHRGRRR